MKISAVIEYQSTAHEVFAMLADEDFQNRKCAATGARRYTVSVKEQGERTVIVNTRDMATEQFPSFVKGMVGDTLAVRETQDWGPAGHDGARTGRLTVDIAGAPIDLKASLSLAPDGAGSVENIDGDLKAKVPMMGSKIEKAAAPAIQSAIRVESETGKAWLATRK